MFRVDVQPERDVVHVVPVGELDLATVGALDGQLRELRDAGFGRLVLDLRRLEFIDLSGLRLILTFDRDARNNGHEFVVIPGPPAIQRLFELAGVDQHLHVQDRPRLNRQDHSPTRAPRAQRAAAHDQRQLQRYIAELHARRGRARPNGSMR
jgi:anti-anti-sigma factor